MAASRNKRSPDLLARVGDFVAARVAPDAQLCVGLSGGCDSVVLLHLLSRLDLSGRLSACHVHHGLSPNADGWAGFCAGYCQSLDVPLRQERVLVEPAGGMGLEAAARLARYAVFARLDADCLLLAQHRGDQAETLLLNILRGAGVTGAAAMPLERRLGARRLLRPLLAVGRAEIEAYARANALRWIEDESNADTGLSRNFLRHTVLTAISARFPGAEAALAQAASHFAEAASLLDEQAAEDWSRLADQETARLAGLRALSLPRLKNLLRWRLRELGWQVPVAARLEEFARQLHTAGPDRHPELVLPAGKMRLAGGRLRWLAAN